MYRAEIEPMPSNPPDRVQYTGLYKVVIYDDARFVRTEKERIAYPEAERLARDLNGKFRVKRKAKSIGR